MHKNRLQEFAQRSNFNLPAYSCVREGPDHAPRFKATVSFNGELFESPGFFSNLRQAEHAAAEAALNALLQRGPSLATKAFVETGICKNMLQETAQRAGLSLPSYNTKKDTTSSVPRFTCTVEVGGEFFVGMPAKSKKQAEKNAAMVAWSSLKQLTQPSRSMEFEGSSSSLIDGNSGGSTGLACHKTGPRPQALGQFHGGRSRVRMVNVRRRSLLSRETSLEQVPHSGGFLPSLPAREGSYESQRFLFNQQSNSTNRDLLSSRISHQGIQMERPRAAPAILENPYESRRFLFNQQPDSDLARSGASAHQQSQPLSGAARDSLTFLPSHSVPRLSGESTSGGEYKGKAPFPAHLHQNESRLFLQSLSDRIELRRPLTKELELQGRDEDFDWAGANSSLIHLQQYQQSQQPCNMPPPSRRAQSERFELKPSLFDELYQRDKEEWWCGGKEMVNLEREKVTTYRDIEKCMFHDGRKGGFEVASRLSGYGDEQESACSPFSRSYRDANSLFVGDANSLFAGYNSTAGLQGAHAHYNEQMSTPSLLSMHSDFQLASQQGSRNLSAPGVAIFSGKALEVDDAWSSRANPAPASLYDTEGMTASSSSRWAPSAQQSISSCLRPSCGALYSWGLQTMDLQAPVRARRQEVAACPAPGPHSADEKASESTNIEYLPPHRHRLPTTLSPDQAKTSASELLKQLRLE